LSRKWQNYRSILKDLINCWFNRREVSFYEKLHPELSGAHEDNPFLSPRMVARKLNTRTEHLEDLVLQHGFYPFRLDAKCGLTRAKASYVKENGFDNTLFHSADLKKLKAVNKSGSSLGDERCEEIQGYGRQHWGSVPFERRLTLTAMARSCMEQLKLYKNSGGGRVPLKLSTYKSYLRPLKLHRNPG
jgi:hypothetical protein